MKETREINRNLFASFIEYAIENKVTNIEWHRFIVNHYKDPVMENARLECAKLLLGYGKNLPSDKNTKSLLYKIAKELRKSA